MCCSSMTTGAHGFSMGYNYNGKLRSAEVLLHEDGSHELIRRAETPADYFATLDCTPVLTKRWASEKAPFAKTGCRPRPVE